MTQLTFDEAFAAYESARARLPSAAARARPPQQVSSLADIADRFDVFLLDAFGVLNIGDTPIEGTPERVSDLQRAGKRVLVVSNAASVPVEALVQKYANLGYDFAEEDIITSRKATIAGLAALPDLHWGVMGLSGVSMEDFGSLRWTLLEDDDDAYEDAEGFLLVGSGDWTAARQHMLETALRAKGRPVCVANPDIIAPRESGYSTEPGYYAHRLAETLGVAPSFFGKPFQNIYDLAFMKTAGVDPSRIVMVGDSLHTDILGAHTAGVSSALISGFGFMAGHDAKAAIARAGILPDFIAERP